MFPRLRFVEAEFGPIQASKPWNSSFSVEYADLKSLRILALKAAGSYDPAARRRCDCIEVKIAASEHPAALHRAILAAISGSTFAIRSTATWSLISASLKPACR